MDARNSSMERWNRPLFKLTNVNSRVKLINVKSCTYLIADSQILYIFAAGNSSAQLKFCIMLKFEDFDFTGKRVRYCGEVQTKFDLSYLIGMIAPYSCYSIYPDAYPYSDYANYLMTHLKN